MSTTTNEHYFEVYVLENFNAAFHNTDNRGKFEVVAKYIVGDQDPKQVERSAWDYLLDVLHQRYPGQTIWSGSGDDTIERKPWDDDYNGQMYWIDVMSDRYGFLQYIPGYIHEHDPVQIKIREEAQADAKKQPAKIEELELLPPMEFIDDQRELEWANWLGFNIDDDYSTATVSFTNFWARLMQVRMAALNDPTDAEIFAVMDDACSEVDQAYGITGFVHSIACGALKLFWVHAEIFGLYLEDERLKMEKRMEVYKHD